MLSKMLKLGGWDMAQWGLLRMHEDLSMDPLHLYKKLGAMARIWNPGQRHVDPRGVLTSQSSQHTTLQVHQETLSQKLR